MLQAINFGIAGYALSGATRDKSLKVSVEETLRQRVRAVHVLVGVLLDEVALVIRATN